MYLQVEHKNQFGSANKRRFAFVRFKDMDGQLAALEAGRLKIDGNWCELKIPRENVSNGSIE